MNENDTEPESEPTNIFMFLRKLHQLYSLYQGQPEQKKNERLIVDIKNNLDILLKLVIKLFNPNYIYNKEDYKALHNALTMYATLHEVLTNNSVINGSNNNYYYQGYSSLYEKLSRDKVFSRNNGRGTNGRGNNVKGANGKGTNGKGTNGKGKNGPKQKWGNSFRQFFTRKNTSK